MSRYTYSPLLPGPDSIRLLRLIPHKDEAAPIQCRLMNYTLQASIRKPCPYEALSYVWGDTNESLSISIDNFHFSVTINLFAALSRLRDRDFERIIWVDAICINQTDDKEKESQIQFMAKIYSQASNVIVWLGEAAENSDRALEDIRVAAAYKLTNSLFHKNSERSILRLLERPWFHRIWVLQEVAAARHVLMICGSAEIDGHAFCLGLDALKRMYEARPDFEGMIRSVIYLIRGAIFRPRHWAHGVGRSSLHISSLGELIDMYHAHKATKRHDKLYALIGMCSDDLSEGGLLPNYELPWEELFQRLVKFIIHQGVWVKTWGDGAMALIKSKACILGKVSISMDSAREEGVAMDITFNHLPEQTKYTKEWTTRWNLHTSAKSIKNGDVICLLQGASKPTIVRLYEDYCAIIVIAVTLPEDTRIDNKWQDLAQSNDLFIRDLLLVWDW
ncbi:heterokaryon incompatibility protein-domain-containing protein, partial [Pyrenochaeta sp. MPI-SDFR-AT-0127]